MRKKGSLDLDLDLQSGGGDDVILRSVVRRSVKMLGETTKITKITLLPGPMLIPFRDENPTVLLIFITLKKIEDEVIVIIIIRILEGMYGIQPTVDVQVSQKKWNPCSGYWKKI